MLLYKALVWIDFKSRSSLILTLGSPSREKFLSAKGNRCITPVRLKLDSNRLQKRRVVKTHQIHQAAKPHKTAVYEANPESQRNVVE